MDEKTGKEDILSQNNEDNINDNLPIMPIENIFKESHEFQIVRISSSDDSNNLDDNKNNCVADVIVLNDDNEINEKDKNVINITDDDLSSEDFDENYHSSLELNVWPVSVNLEMDGGSLNLNDSEGDSDNGDDDTCRETDETCSSNPKNTMNDGIKKRKKKRFSKVRKKRKLSVNYFCKQCDGKFHSELELNIHILTTHNINNNLNNNKFTCLLCNKVFNVKSYLDAHISKAHTEQKSINCTKCNKVFKYRSYLTSSSSIKKPTSIFSNNHKNKQFTCFHCNLKRL